MRVGHLRWALSLVLAGAVLSTNARPSQPPATTHSRHDLSFQSEDFYNVSSIIGGPLEVSRRQDGKVDLRILNLGASIVYGTGSSTGNS